MTMNIETNRSLPKTLRSIRGSLLDYRKDRLGFLQRLAREGDVCDIHFGPFSSILFNKPEHVQSILVDHAYDFDKGVAIRTIFRPPSSVLVLRRVMWISTVTSASSWPPPFPASSYCQLCRHRGPIC